MILHIRLLWKAPDPTTVPTPPAAEFKAAFSRRFKDLKLVEERSGAGPSVIERVSSDKLDALRDLPATGKIVRDMRRIDQNVISVIFSYLANYGFTAWKPDLTETSTSLWNTACKIVAIDSFKQAMASHGYHFLQPNADYMSNHVLLSDIYNQFVWVHMKGLHELELRRTGAVAEKAVTGEVYRRRKAVSGYTPI